MVRSAQLVAWVTIGFLVGVSIEGAIFHSVVSAQSATPQQSTVGHVFGSDAGLVLNFINADKTADFEATVKKLGQALATSDKPERREQARGWKVFKAVEPANNGGVLYVFTIDPVVKGADYSVAKILAEAFPQEVQELYERFAASYSGGQNVVNLTLVAALGSATTTTASR